MKTSLKFRKALNLLKKDGWCKHKFVKKNGARCSLGAMYVFDVDGEELEIFRKGINDYFITGWNDEPERTFEEVEAAFELAIVEADDRDFKRR